MRTWKSDTKNMRRPDEAILEDIWRELWKDETIRALDIHDISVDVENGEVCLSGHPSKDIHPQQMIAIAQSIPGVIRVHNNLIADHDMRIQVAQALGNDECTRPFVLPVFCFHGCVQLGGIVPNRTIQHIAAATAASVPAVRGVVLLPSIEGEQSPTTRDAIQPGIGARMYGEDGTEGNVYQVVISPQNRLVTHAVVRVIQTLDGRQVYCDYMIPVEVMQVVSIGGIFLNHKAAAIPSFPIFNPAHYPLAPLTWQPPYPYAVGSVRWPPNHPAKAAPVSAAKSVKADIQSYVKPF